jgi:hypothetical protein
LADPFDAGFDWPAVTDQARRAHAVLAPIAFNQVPQFRFVSLTARDFVWVTIMKTCLKRVVAPANEGPRIKKQESIIKKLLASLAILISKK